MGGEDIVKVPFITKLLHNFFEIRLLKLLFTYVQLILFNIIFDVHETTNYSIKRTRLKFFNWYSYLSLSNLTFFLLYWFRRMVLRLLIDIRLLILMLMQVRLIILIPLLWLLLRNVRLWLIMVCLHSRISLCDLIALIKSFWLFGVVYQKMMKLSNHC